MTPTATSKPKRRDWAALDRQHQRRGTLAFTLLLNPEVLKAPVRKVGRGRPQRYTDTFIEALLTMRVALRLPYRVLEGAARAIFQSHGLDPEQVPDHTLLCKRQAQLAPRLPAFRPGEHTCLLVDSTGLKVAGYGEWNTRQHGVQGRRTWVKVHLLTDAATGQIIDMAVTPPTEGDSPVFEKLVEGKDLTGVTTIGDGAYDSKRCYTAVHAAGGRHLAPPKMGAMRWDRKVPAYRQRNRHIDNIHLVGRPAWKKWAKYHRRSAVESAMHRWKWVTGERALSRTLNRLKVEGVLRARFLNSLIASTAI